VLPDTKLGCHDSKPLPPGLQPTPYCEDVSVGHSRRRHTSYRVDCVILSLENVYIPVGIGERKNLKVCLWTSCEHVLPPHISRWDFCKLESQCPHHVAWPENFYLEIFCPCLYVPTRGGANGEIGIETRKWLLGRSLSLRSPDADISSKHRLQIECICTYHCILQGTACPINHTPTSPLSSRQCRDRVRTSSWQAYAFYRRPDFLTMLWHQTCFFR